MSNYLILISLIVYKYDIFCKYMCQCTNLHHPITVCGAMYTSP